LGTFRGSARGRLTPLPYEKGPFLKDFIQYLKELWRRKDLLWYLVTSGLKADTRNTLLGYFWWLLDPFLMVVVFLFVRAVFMGATKPEDIAFLTVGLVVFQAFSKSMTMASSSITGKAGLITQVYLPKAIFPFGVVLTQLINFLFSLVTVVVILGVLRVRPSIHLLWLPYLVLVQTLFYSVIALVVAYAASFVRDLGNILGYITMVLRFATPVIWEADRIPQRMRWLVEGIPVSWILTDYRNVLLYNMAPDWVRLAWLAIVSSVLIVVLLLFYTYKEHGIVKVL